MARRRRPALLPLALALAVLSCLQLLITLPAAVSAVLPSSSTRPHQRPLATATATDQGAGGGGGGVERRACTYTVQIKTSCSSPRSSPDAVSLAFGDAYKNEVYAAAVSPAYGFERCARDTFKVSGPCGYGVCYLYLRRTGSVGWTPEWVRVYEPASDSPSTFYFGDPLANGVWYGLNRCLRRAGAGAAPDAAAAAQAL